MDKKKQHIRLIHVAKRQLRLDDDIYRANLKEATGKSSCSDMSLAELMQALEQFKKLGFKPTVKKPLKGKRYSPKSGRSRTPVIDKIRAVWIQMANHMIVRDNSETALDAYVRRMLKGAVDSVAWLDWDQATRVLEALKRWHRRELIERIIARGQQPYINELTGKVAGYDVIVEQYEGAV